MDDVTSLALLVVAIRRQNHGGGEGDLGLVYIVEVLLNGVQEMTGETLLGRLQLIEFGAVHVGFMKKRPRKLHF